MIYFQKYLIQQSKNDLNKLKQYSVFVKLFFIYLYFLTHNIFGDDMFKPKKIYYEENILNYPLGKKLIKKYKDIPKSIIQSHNNIEELRKKENKEFVMLKKNLIIGVRKTHKYVPNYKVSDYLVPYTSSGCTAMCLYCYLVCHYNKCAYLRLFVNREQMLKKIIDTAEKAQKDLVFEIGSNSDLVLENEITNNLEWTIKNFSKSKYGKLTFPTKFHMVDTLLDLPGKDKIIIRISLNPEYIINKVEIGTSNLNQRIEALIKLKKAGYKVGILIAPIILLDDYKKLYEELIITLRKALDPKLSKDMFFELIFMTYSYVHNAINTDAFPKSVPIYSKEKFVSRGRYKYSYKKDLKEEGEKYIKGLLEKYFPEVPIIYCV